PDDALWFGVVRGVDLAHATGAVPELAEVCEAWGVAVAALHRLPTSRIGITEAPRPWLLEAQRRARLARGVRRGSARATVMDALDREPSLRAALEQVSARWTERHWMHGELRPHNVVVESNPPLRVRFLDFGQAGLGDPAWDLATAVDSITGLAPGWMTPAEPLVDYFLRGYRRAGGPGTLYPAVQASSALATAWQLADTTDGTSDQLSDGATIGRWLDRARAFARRAGMQPRAAA
ncbi:MAG: aminoglycoside phosphotransferase family protein, partial [Propionibacteriaceae bacterium]